MIFTEDGAFRFSSSKFSPEAKLKLKFDFGDFDHPIYGKTKNLSGGYTLFHRHGLYPVSSYFKLSKDAQNSLLKSTIVRLRKLAENLDEDDLHHFFLQSNVASALCSPHMDPHSRIFELTVDEMALACSSDDALEDHEFFKDLPATYQTLNPELKKFESYRKSMNTLIQDTEKIEEIMGQANHVLPDSETFLKTAKQMAEKIKAEFPEEIPKTIKIVPGALACSVEAGILSSQLEGSFALTEKGRKALRGHEAGMGAFLEFSAFLQRFTVPKYIRNTLLFGLLLQGVRDFGGLTNDLIGLLKDTKEEESHKNVILRRVVREGISIEQSFAQAQKDLTDTISDMEVAMSLLLQSFPGEEGLRGFIDAAKNLCDGQSYSYEICARVGGRYGDTITVKIEPDDI